VLAAALAIRAVAGCGGQGDATRESNRGATELASGGAASAVKAGRPGGMLVVGSLAGPKTFNPVVSSETSSSDVWQLMFDGLVAFDPLRMSFEPRIAESWTVSDDGRTWTFKIRDGLRWSDGAEITAGDAKFTFDVIYDDRVPAVGREVLSLAGRPFDVRAPDSHTLVISTEEPYGPMLYALAAAFWPLPEHALLDEHESGRFPEALGVGEPAPEVVTSGPFALELREPGRTVLKRNPSYWRTDASGNRLPYLDRVVFVEIPDWNAWRLRFEAGEVDYYRCRPEEVTELTGRAEKGDYRVYDLGLEAGTTHLWYNLNPGRDENGEPYVAPHKREWFEDVRFRRATSCAIDRESIVKAVYDGWGGAIYGPTSPVDKLWYNPGIPKYDYDPRAADSLLADMGLVDRDGDGTREDASGHEVKFTLISNSESRARTRMGEMIAADLRRVGIDAAFNSVDFNTLVTRIGDTYRYEACLLSVTAGPDPVGGLDIWLSGGWMHAFRPNQERPATAWEAEVDGYVRANLTARTYEERKKAWDEVQRLYAENLGFIFIANPRTVIAVRDRFGNVRPQPYQEWHRVAWNAAEIFVRVRA